MNDMSRQAGLFDTDRRSEQAETVAARARMRETIDRLSALAAPSWTHQIDVILMDGAFKRAMRLVPDDEAQALWAEFDAHMERLYAVWAANQVATDTTGHRCG